GYKPTLVGGTGHSPLAEPKGASTPAPAKASSGATVTAFSGSAARKIEPTIAISTSEVVSFKRDYEERAIEFAEEIADEDLADESAQEKTALFSDKAAADAA